MDDVWATLVSVHRPIRTEGKKQLKLLFTTDGSIKKLDYGFSSRIEITYDAKTLLSPMSEWILP